MKKIYEKPVVNIITMNLESMIATSADSIQMGTTSYDGSTKIESNERRGIFSNDDAPSYNRSLW
ncbi:MAG: hypothetical protein IKQ62_01655 [Bacteroidaceae bacterium]|nr:hypothetical protein [Bacteroidaceae bacterium]